MGFCCSDSRGNVHGRGRPVEQPYNASMGLKKRGVRKPVDLDLLMYMPE